MDKKRAAYQALVDRVLNAEGAAPAGQRARAFDGNGLPDPMGALIGKVTARPARVADADFDADFDAAIRAGYSQDQIFELVVCAAVGQSARLYDAGLAALAEADEETRHAT